MPAGRAASLTRLCWFVHPWTTPTRRPPVQAGLVAVPPFGSSDRFRQAVRLLTAARRDQGGGRVSARRCPAKSVRCSRSQRLTGQSPCGRRDGARSSPNKGRDPPMSCRATEARDSGSGTRSLRGTQSTTVSRQQLYRRRIPRRASPGNYRPTQSWSANKPALDELRASEILAQVHEETSEEAAAVAARKADAEDSLSDLRDVRRASRQAEREVDQVAARQQAREIPADPRTGPGDPATR